MARQSLGRLTASPDVRAAAWILAALRDFDHTVGSIVPPVFDAYARVFHPAYRNEGQHVIPVRWAEVARGNGCEMHPAVEWGSIAGSWELQHRFSRSGLWDVAPSIGRLPHELAQRLVETLSGHAKDPNHGYFGIWQGWGHGSGMFLFKEGTPKLVQQRARDAFDAEEAAWRGLLDSAAIVELPHRAMHLVGGPLVAIEDFYECYAGPSSVCRRDPPSLWWSADESWCVASDIDLMTTYVGASRGAIAAVLGDDRLEALPVPDDQNVTWEADKINPLPAPPRGAAKS